MFVQILFLSFLFSVYSEHTGCQCGTKNIERIIGGEDSEEGEWPMMVALVSKPDQHQFCGGTIISHRHVITAGHCVHMHYRKMPTNSFGVVYGINNLDKVKASDVHSPKRIISHPKYGWPLSYDVAILVMNAIKFSDNIGPACLPSGIFDSVGKTMDHTGWGMVKAHGEGSRILKKTKLLGVSLDMCNSTFSQYAHAVKVRKHHLCTFQKATSQCKGDSGGPILWVDPQSKRYNLVGIISFGWYSCDTPSVNVAVSHFVPWIREILMRTGEDCAFQGLNKSLF